MATTEKLILLERLIRTQHTPQEGVHEDMGGADTVYYCGGCGTDLDEDACPYLAIIDAPD